MNDIIYAHCKYIKIEAVEVYSYSVEMDTNPSIKDLVADGYVDVYVPLDQVHRYHRRIDIVNRRLASHQRTENIGRLYISNSNVYATGNATGQLNVQNIALDIPFHETDKQHEYNRFVYGSLTFPTDSPIIAPWQWPFSISVDVFDEYPIDNTVRRSLGDERTNPDITEITEHSDFQRQLVLQFKLRLAIPRSRYRGNFPVLQSVQLDWPVTTSYHSIELEKGSQTPVLRYIAKKNCVEWKNTGFKIVLPKDLTETEQNLIVFEIDDLLLSLKEPGEFYNTKDPVPCRLEIEIPDCLLSGTQVDYFDATGAASQDGVNGKISLKSMIKIDMKINLEQRFNRRKLSPLYELFFEGLILRKEQVQAIENILKDFGFSKEKGQPLSSYKEGTEEKTGYGGHFMGKHGHSRMRLWVRATGIKKTTNRETTVPGGRKYLTPVESGNTEIALRAEMEGEVSDLTDIMNSIHKALENHFRYMTPPS